MRPVLGVSAHLEEAATKIDADDGTIGHGQEREEHTQHHHGSSKETLLSSSRHAGGCKARFQSTEVSGRLTARVRPYALLPPPSLPHGDCCLPAVLMPQPSKRASARHAHVKG